MTSLVCFIKIFYWHVFVPEQANFIFIDYKSINCNPELCMLRKFLLLALTINYGSMVDLLASLDGVHSNMWPSTMPVITDHWACWEWRELKPSNIWRATISPIWLFFFFVRLQKGNWRNFPCFLWWVGLELSSPASKSYALQHLCAVYILIVCPVPSPGLLAKQPFP